MTEMHVLRVFTAEDGTAGNPLGVFLDGRAISGEHRQAVAAHLGFSETVFVDDIEQARVQIFDPASEIPFAGHPGWRRPGSSQRRLEARSGDDMAHPRRRNVVYGRRLAHE